MMVVQFNKPSNEDIEIIRRGKKTGGGAMHIRRKEDRARTFPKTEAMSFRQEGIHQFITVRYMQYPLAQKCKMQDAITQTHTTQCHPIIKPPFPPSLNLPKHAPTKPNSAPAHCPLSSPSPLSHTPYCCTQTRSWNSTASAAGNPRHRYRRPFCSLCPLGRGNWMTAGSNWRTRPGSPFYRRRRRWCRRICRL